MRIVRGHDAINEVVYLQILCATARFARVGDWTQITIREISTGQVGLVATSVGDAKRTMPGKAKWDRARTWQFR